MGLKEIEIRILKQAEKEAEKIKAANEQQIKTLQEENSKKISALKMKLEKEAQHKVNDLKLSLLVPARLEAKKNILEAKQSVLKELYDSIKKEKKLSDPELNQLREKTEIKIGEILFGN